MADNLQWGLVVDLRDQVSKPAREIVGNVNALRDALMSLKEVGPIRQSVRVIEELRQVTKKTTTETHNYRENISRTVTETHRFREGTLGASRAVGRLARSTREARTELSFFQRTVSAITAQFAASALVGRVHALVGSFKSMVRVGATFDQTMTAVGANLEGATAGQIQAVREEALRLGATTAFTAQDAAKGFLGLAKSGYSAGAAIKAMAPILHLAGAEGISIEKSMKVTNQTLKVFGLRAGEVTRVVNVLSRAAKASNIEVSDIGHSLKYVGPVAAVAGRSLEEVAGALAVLGDRELKGAMGGTGLRQILGTLAKESKRRDEVLSAVGLTAADVDPSKFSIVQILEKLGPRINSMGTALKLFGDRGGPAFLALANAQGEVNGQWLKGAEYLKAMTRQMHEGKTAAQIYEVMMDTVAGKMKLWESGVEGIRLAIFEGLKEPLKEFLAGAANWLGRLSVVLRNLGPVIKQIFLAGIAVVSVFARSIGGAVGLTSRAFKILSSNSREQAQAIDNVVTPMAVAMAFFKAEAELFAVGLVKGLKQGFGAFKAVLGIAFTAFDGIVGWFLRIIGVSDKSASAAERFGQRVGLAVGILAGIVAVKLAAILPLLVAKTFWAWGTAAVGAFRMVAMGAAWVYGALQGLFIVGLRAAVTALVTFGQALLASPVTWYVAAILAIAAAIYIVIKYWDQIKAAGTKALLWIHEHIVLVGAALTWLAGPFGYIAAVFIYVAGSIVKHWDTVKDAFSIAWSSMKIFFYGFIDEVKKNWKAFTDSLREVWNSAVNSIPKGLRQTLGEVIKWLAGALEKIATSAGRVIDWIGKKFGVTSAGIKQLAAELRRDAEYAEKRASGKVDVAGAGAKTGAAIGVKAAAEAAKAKAREKAVSEVDILRRQVADPSLPTAHRRKLLEQLQGKIYDAGLQNRLKNQQGLNASILDAERRLQQDETSEAARAEAAAKGRGALRVPSAAGVAALDGIRPRGGRAAEAAERAAGGGRGGPPVSNTFHFADGSIRIEAKDYDADKLSRDLFPSLQRVAAEYGRSGW
jgi:TP901 family phage tail tape measure protein